jgi:hypothetical protein
MTIAGFDIETVTQYKSLQDAPQEVKDAWSYTCQSKYSDVYYESANMECEADLYEKKACLYPEYGKIVCISVITSTKGLMKSFAAANTPTGEADMIVEFNNYITAEGVSTLFGHSVNFFDIPYVVTRSLANNIEPHRKFVLNGVKPWESWVIDTHTEWKGSVGRTCNAANLISMCLVLGVPSPKSDISGKDVSRVYWENPEGNLPRIVTYCENDVMATASCFKILKQRKIIKQSSW